MSTTEREPAAPELPFDPDALRARYEAEREKRIRTDGNDQYIEVVGRFERYLDDPYVPRVERAPLHDEVDVVVVGGGFGGLLVGARLKQAGIDDVRLVEKGGDVGGTWYWNRYPGAMCDVESYIYLPLLEEVGYMPVEKYSHAPEILEHSRAIARRFGLYDNACFGTEVTSVEWEEADARWIVRTNRGDAMRARFVVMANGPLHRPKLPGLEGIEEYEGHSFHTSRWDYDYTGGTSDGGLTGLAGKRIGIIGTGATAIQCIPHLAEHAEHLYVFQRTPSSIDRRDNRPTDAEWAASLGPGWQKHRMDNFNTLVSGGFASEDLVGDGWTDIIVKLLLLVRKGADVGDPAALARTMESADFEKMEQIRARVDEIVRNPAVADALKPWYRQFCKRPCFHDEYLDAYNRDNVTLVDTQGRGVERITRRGVIANGVEHELDCIVFATGFEVGTGYTRRAGYDVVGRDGVTLSEKWEDGPSTLHGLFTRGFPNCLVVSLSQSGFSVNFPHMLDEQARHIAYVLRHVFDNEVRTIEPTQDAEDAWVQTIVEKAVVSMAFLESCTPGYYNNEGRPAERSLRNTSYGGGAPEFVKVLEAWRAEGTLLGLELR